MKPTTNSPGGIRRAILVLEAAAWLVVMVLHWGFTKFWPLILIAIVVIGLVSCQPSRASVTIRNSFNTYAK